jgi:hypothetical protein
MRFFVLLAVCGLTGSLAATTTAREPVLWTLDDLQNVGGSAPTLLGQPRSIHAPGGGAVEFDGQDDALVVDRNPLADLEQFTVETVFRPDRGGAKEQRFLHFQENESDSRLLFETRLTDDGQWFLDTYLKSGEAECTLLAKESLHPLGRWFHAAVVVDGKSMRHFVNGSEELQADIASQPLRAGQTSIGVRLNKVFWFRGAIRLVRVTPRALAPQDFQDVPRE